MRVLMMLATALLLTACGQAAPNPEPPPVPVPGPRTAVDFTGRWTGPEGLFLDIADQGAGRYRLTLKDTLDREGVYEGRAAEGGLAFVRDGEALTIRPGTGEETGFKWLADKTDCLIVVVGQEGYCRA